MGTYEKESNSGDILDLMDDHLFEAPFGRYHIQKRMGD